MHRLSRGEQDELARLSRRMEDPASFARYGEILARTDFYDPLPVSAEGVDLRPDIYQGVWPEAKELRRTGELLKMGAELQCPVVAVHGDHDPHPAEGVQKPLAKTLKDFRFVLLEKCGHVPWLEKQARDEFFRVLNDELGN
jgi:pimeloyl-ACP methyl ester carboxylesterase